MASREREHARDSKLHNSLGSIREQNVVFGLDIDLPAVSLISKEEELALSQMNAVQLEAFWDKKLKERISQSKHGKKK